VVLVSLVGRLPPVTRVVAAVVLEAVAASSTSLQAL